MEESDFYQSYFVMSEKGTEKLSNMSESQIHAIAARLADSIRDTEAKIRHEYEKE